MAYCANCGNELPADAAACPHCGHVPGRPAGAFAVRRTEGTAVASLVLAIVGFVTCPLVFHIVAVILGNQAQTKIRQDPSLDGEGLARAGVILGWIGIGLGALMLLFFLAAFALSAGGMRFN